MPVERLAFGSFRLDSENGTLLRDGELVPIGQKGALILGALLKSPGEALTKAQLMDAAWPGLAVEESNLSVQIASLRKALGPAPDGGDWILTVPRVGYRLVVQRKPATIRTADVVGFSPDSVPPRLSLVVLPFANIGKDPEQDYFVDGVTESLTTDLSRISSSLVIARNTAFTYKGKPIDVKAIGRELNVRYVLEGSVQRSRDRMRVNVQLVDVESGNHLWAERFDKPLADLFEMQDEIVVRLASQLSAELVSAEARRAGKSPNPDAFDLYFQGMAWLNKGTSTEYARYARSFFSRALAIDPDHIDALIGCAVADNRELFRFETSERQTVLAAAEASLSRALSLSPDSARAHLALSELKSLSNQPEQGLAEAEQALALGGNLGQALAAKSTAKLFLGFAEEAVECRLQALRLSPRDPFNSHAIGAAKLHLGDYQGARNWLSQSIAANPNYAMSRFFLAAALGQLGRIKEAHAETQAGLALNPTFTINRFREGAETDNPVFLKQRHNIYEGLRKAGLPEE